MPSFKLSNSKGMASKRDSKTDLSHYKDNALMVVALDFGTTYSGYAFSFRNNPYEIFANQQWDSGKYHLNSYKTPTCVLINKQNPQDYKFGYDAENDYSDIQAENETDNYYFFDRFKMRLHLRKDVSEEMKLYDIRGEALPATDVFSTAIRALKDHVLAHLSRRGSHIKFEDIKWVLTVPAIWTDKAKTFMRICAKKAGIESMYIALEPEAASIYCQHVYRKADDSGVMSGPMIIKQGSSYLVIDIGGGTIDITAHEKEIHHKVKELCQPVGAAFGGTNIDEAFMNIMEEIVGPTVIEKMKKEYTGNYIDLVRGFEILKRNIMKKRQKINFTIPLVAIDTICQLCLEKPFSQALSESCYSDRISLLVDKLQIDKNLLMSLFTNTVDKMIEEIRMTVRQAETSDTSSNIKCFLLVGGFSESEILQKTIKDAFPDKEVIIPDDPTLAVVRGAVLFGHIPDFLSSRYTRFAYGRRIRPLFDETIHDITKSVRVDGKDRCKDVFELFMEKNTYCHTGTTRQVEYHTMEEMQKKITVAVYVSDNNDTRYVDEEGCEKLGELVVDIPNPTKERRFVDVVFEFGGTELMVKAKVKGTQEECTAGFKLI